ncbi:PAS domain-containing sensor histidine kinase [Microvirga sp. 2TAF3]|uniref:PAS domain-containing sensor histidine kinase n=1 Tax=Microvirga sp. 2TAF3 TaxID=3233014 RepID=UPI003F9ABFC0
MTDAPNQFEAMIARLAADPALAMLAKPETGTLVWDRMIERLLWVSPAAERLRHVFADESGRVASDLRARDRLKALAAGIAPREGMRLERLWLDPTRLSPPVTVACRLVEGENGETVLVTGIVGAVPRLPGRLRPVRVADPAGGQSPPVAVSAERPSASREKPRSTIRFVWQTDPQTRFLHVSSGLAEAVGPVASDIVGQSWDEVSRSVVEDPGGEIASLFARRETWRGRTIAWNIENSSLQVPVDWAGMPVFGAGRKLLGFRGFGLLRMDAVRERSAPEGIPTGGHSLEGTSQEQSSHALGDKAPENNPAGAEDALSQEESLFERLRETVAATLAEAVPPEQQVEAASIPSAPPERPRPVDAAFGLSSTERNAFREIARALGARFEPDISPAETVAPAIEEETPSSPPSPPFVANGDRVLDRLPIGVLVHRGEEILFANRLLLDLTSYEDTGQMNAEGGLVHLFRGSPVLQGTEEGGPPLALTTRADESIAVDVRLSNAEWDGAPASLMTIRKIPDTDAGQRLRIVEMDLRQRESRVHELESILDTATDGVIVLDETGRILSLNRSAEALFGYDQREVVGDAITVLLSPESHIVALDYLEGLRSPGVKSLLNDGREVQGRVRQGGTIPLFMTMGHVNDGPDRKFCAVLRDITAFKKAEGELIGAKRAAEEASAQKSDLLAKISHEIRTPLNAILGFAEVMLEERFGPIGNERYKEYLKDVHASGAHVISLVNDLLDLAKVEAGRMELSFTSVNLNDLVSACFTLLQPQAARDRIVMRTSFPAKLPPVVADERSVRQIVLNLVSNAIKFTDAGGQVIVSTALTDRGEVAFRVRDTGIGMTEKEVEAALEPFRQLATARKRGGTGLGLPLTKALVEANRGALQITSHPNEGTLVEVIFPPTRVLAE